MDKYTKRAIAVKAEYPMEHGKTWGAVCGVAGGMGNYLLQTNTAFPHKLMEAVVTAFICGLVGAFGKWVFDVVRKKLSKSKL